MQNNTNIIIKDNRLILNSSININELNNYLDHFKDYKKNKNINFQSDELLYILYKIKTGDSLEKMIKFFEYYHANKSFILHYLSSIDLLELIEIYNNIKDCSYVIKEVESIIIDKLNKYNINEIIKLVIQYNIKFYILYLNLQIDFEFDDVTIYKYKFYINSLKNLAKSKNISKDNIIFDINLYNNIKLMTKAYCEIFSEEYDFETDTFKILLENRIIANIYLYNNMKNKSKLKPLFDIYKNDKIYYLLDIYVECIALYLKDNGEMYAYMLSDLIKNDIFKIEVLNHYINGHYFPITYLDFINYIINDNNISEDIIKKIILIKSPYINLLDYLYYKINLINRKNIASFIKNKYNSESIKSKSNCAIIQKFLKDINYDNSKIPDLNNSNNIYGMLNNLIDSKIEKTTIVKIIYFVLSKKLNLDNLNVEKAINHIMLYVDTISLLEIIVHNIKENFIQDFKDSNLYYILKMKKTKNNIHIFDKEISFISDNVSKCFGFVVDENLIIYILKNFIDYENKIKYIKYDVYCNIKDFILKIVMYAIRYKYYKLLECIFKYNPKLIYVKRSFSILNNEYFLIDFAYTKKSIEMIYNYMKNPYEYNINDNVSFIYNNIIDVYNDGLLD